MSSSQKLKSVSLWLAWSLFTWLALAALAYGLAHDFSDDSYTELPSRLWWIALTLPSTAVLCGCRALHAANPLGRTAR